VWSVTNVTCPPSPVPDDSLSTYPIGKKEKREKNERMISMWKKAKAFFFPGSYFLFPLLLFSRFSQKKERRFI
jgi:hypothetical protein